MSLICVTLRPFQFVCKLFSLKEGRKREHSVAPSGHGVLDKWTVCFLVYDGKQATEPNAPHVQETYNFLYSWIQLMPSLVIVTDTRVLRMGNFGSTIVFRAYVGLCYHC
jgi:hypothetical protein